MVLPRHRAVLIAAVVLALLASGCLRPDDLLEPNNNVALATALQVGQIVEARANQGDPDVYKIAARRGQSLHFKLQSRGLEECPGFRLEDPRNQVLFKTQARCRRVGHQAPEKAAGVTWQTGADFGYRLSTTAEIDGFYYLIILEGSDADNLFPYSWDYRLVVDVR